MHVQIRGSVPFQMGWVQLYPPVAVAAVVAVAAGAAVAAGIFRAAVVAIAEVKCSDAVMFRVGV